jgi:peptidoglycan/xylan/chitin deacetylase (PgdA/CDA1 family)
MFGLHRRLLIFRLLALWDKVVSSRGVPAALYHQVTDTPKGHRIGAHVSPQVFSEQMNRLVKLGYHGISIREYQRLLGLDQPLPSKIVCLTFDDGQQDVYIHAYPVLKELGFSATVFVITDYVGQEKWFDLETGVWCDEQPHPQAFHYRLMDWDQIGEMQTAGFEFGTHSRTHPRLTGLTEKDMKEEIEGSKATLEGVLRRRVETFCYPFGSFDDTVRQAVINAGYKAACSSVHGLNVPTADPFALRRYGIASITGPAFDVYLTSKYAWYYRNSRQQWRKA